VTLSGVRTTETQVFSSREIKRNITGLSTVRVINHMLIFINIRLSNSKSSLGIGVILVSLSVFFRYSTVSAPGGKFYYTASEESLHDCRVMNGQISQYIVPFSNVR
jgi:hypothetical protein